MRYAKMAVLLGGAMAVAPAAWGDTTYVVDKVIISGSKTVPVEKLYAAIQEHAGSRVTTADIIADQDAITKVLSANNVVGGIKTSMAAQGKHITVTFALDDQGAQAPVVTHVAPKLHQETFTGNNSISSDKLAAATGLTPGEDLNNDKILAAQKAIVQAYKDAKLPISVNVAGSNTAAGNGQVDVNWTITETKAKKKKHADDDDGQKVDQ